MNWELSYDSLNNRVYSNCAFTVDIIDSDRIKRRRVDESNKRKREPEKKQNTKKPKRDEDLIRKIIEESNYRSDSSSSDGNDGETSGESTEDEYDGECNNPLCDHKKGSPIKMEIKRIETIDDIIELGKKFHCKRNRKFNGIDMRILCNLVLPLTELRDLIGMKAVKQNIINQIIFFLEGFNKSDKCNNCINCAHGVKCDNTKNNDMLHTVITGPPGVGKTELGRILGKVYKALGILSSDTMKIATRSDLIGKYLGHTAAKTQAFIDSCKGGVMFIDEAYSLGNPEGRDSFSKECLDTLNQNMSERRDFLVIIAGYKDALEKCFFNYNEGLKRRFSFRYEIDGYTSDEIMQIFKMKIQKGGWELESDVKLGDTPETINEKEEKNRALHLFFMENLKYFPHFGGDTETLFLNCKIYHAKRVFMGPESAKKVLTLEDINEAFQVFVGHRKYKKNDSLPPMGMYT